MAMFNAFIEPRNGGQAIPVPILPAEPISRIETIVSRMSRVAGYLLMAAAMFGIYQIVM